MLVLDESQSINAFSAIGAVRTAATTFVEAFKDTGSPLAIAAFHSVARQGVGYNAITTDTVSQYTSFIGPPGSNAANPGGYSPPAMAQTSNTTLNQPNGTTNWQDAFLQSAEALPAVSRCPTSSCS
jgi:hypothetical protein